MLLQPGVARHALLVVRVLLVVDERVAHQRRAVEQDAAHRVQRKDLGRPRAQLARREVDLEARLLGARGVRPRLERRHGVQGVVDPRVGPRALVNVDKGGAEGERVARRVRLLVAVLDAAPRPVRRRSGSRDGVSSKSKRSLRGAAPRLSSWPPEKHRTSVRFVCPSPRVTSQPPDESSPAHARGISRFDVTTNRGLSHAAPSPFSLRRTPADGVPSHTMCAPFPTCSAHRHFQLRAPPPPPRPIPIDSVTALAGILSVSSTLASRTSHDAASRAMLTSTKPSCAIVPSADTATTAAPPPTHAQPCSSERARQPRRCCQASYLSSRFGFVHSKPCEPTWTRAVRPSAHLAANARSPSVAGGGEVGGKSWQAELRCDRDARAAARRLRTQPLLAVRIGERRQPAQQRVVVVAARRVEPRQARAALGTEEFGRRLGGGGGRRQLEAKVDARPAATSRWRAARL